MPNDSCVCHDVGTSHHRDLNLRGWPTDGGREMTRTKVADLTEDELRDLIGEVVARTIPEIVEDPDKGLDRREEVELSLRDSLAHVEAGGSTMPAEHVAADLGLEW